MTRNAAIGLLVLGTPLWLTSCGAPTPSDEGPEPGADLARRYDVSPDGGRVLLLKPQADDEVAPTTMFVDNWFEELRARVPVR
ncbi:MAG TPA: hypothetical protein QF572_01420 [Vicinamibacterales bacterium]|nr:hypothetical protein [Vicinamibacterales bacterium]|tara:strand:+ start:2907 stop:3155 length:249 start_codon:yes stop_codon:yes gene_type:complete